MSTKKIRILIIALVAALLVGTGAYIAVDTLKTREEQATLEEANSLRLFTIDADSIDKVEMQIPEGYFIAETTADGWEITDTDYQYDFVLNDYYLNTICSYLSDLTALKKLNIQQDALSGYGLADPQPLTCYIGDTAYTIYLGSASATEEYYYIMLPDDSTVYAIDFDTGEILAGGLSYLKDPYMISYFDVNINYVKLTRKGETAFEITKDEDNRWQMAQPLVNAQLNSANISAMLTSLTRLQIESFIKMAENGQDLYDYHLDNPAYQLMIKTVNGETQTIDFADFDTSDSSVYLVYEESGQIASMSSRSVSFLQAEASELMTDKIFSPDYLEIANLDVQVDDLHFSMTMNHAENQYILLQDDETELIIPEDSQSTFKSLFQTISNLTYDSLDIDAEPDTEAESSVIFRYTLTDGTETVLSLIPIDDTYYWAFLDDEYTGKIVRRRALSGSAGVLTYYEKLTDEITMNTNTEE